VRPVELHTLARRVIVQASERDAPRDGVPSGRADRGSRIQEP